MPTFMPVLTATDWAILRALRPLPARSFTFLSHLWLFHELPSFRHPRTFTELIQAKKLFDRDPLLTVTADKYAVRKYVADRVGAEHLVPLIAVVDDPAELDLGSLPESFVVKATHGNNATLIVRDKACLDWPASMNAMRNWLEDNWYRYNKEWAYKEWAYRDIPARLVVEQFLDEGGQPPTDYKFFVFSGKVRLAQVDVARFTEHQRNLFDEHWRSLAVGYRYPRPPTPREGWSEIRVQGSHPRPGASK